VKGTQMSETKTVILPSNPAAIKAIKSAAREASDCYLRISAEKDQIKAIVEKIAEEHELPKPYVNKMFRTYHKASFDKEQMEQADFSALYETIFEVNKE
jgi:predicted metalloendopeptidase